MTGDTTPFCPSGTGPELAAAPGVPADPFPGEFRLVRRLGHGTFGEVWLADDLSPLARPVALKFLKMRASSAQHARAVELLRNEARLLAALRHPHVVQIFAWRQAGDLPCLVLQYVPGGSLDAVVRADGPLPWQRAARYVADVGEGLMAVHRRGVVHRDVKPANLLYDPETDEAVLTDLGIAARLGAQETVAGTLPFMPPEAFRHEGGEPLDVYGLAASLFWLLTGTLPFPHATVPALLDAITAGLPSPDPRFAAVPAPLERLIRAGLTADPAGRPPLPQFVAALRGGLNGLLADDLAAPAARSRPVDLRLLVSRQDGPDTVTPIAATTDASEVHLRDLKRVPPPPDRVRLRTGDRVRIEVQADRPGYVVVFNVGPTGNLNLLYPNEPDRAAPLAGGERLHLLDVELTPPAGHERLFAVWTRQPLPLRLDELRSLADVDAAPDGYRATRDMVRVRRSLAQLPPADRHAVVLRLDHA